MELPYYRGHSENKECIKRPPSIVLDIEVEECIGSGETALRDERAVEQQLVIDLLGLLGN